MKSIYWAAILALVAGCKTRQTDKSAEFSTMYVPGPHVIVYKTKANYDHLVPIQLSEDKSRIISYPDPSDVISGNGFQYPNQLHQGYLLDNRGIGKNSVFLDLSYEEYAKLPGPLSHEEMMDLILDKDPFSELIDCGNRIIYKDVVTEINQIIDSGKLRSNPYRVIK